MFITLLLVLKNFNTLNLSNVLVELYTYISASSEIVFNSLFTHRSMDHLQRSHLVSKVSRMLLTSATEIFLTIVYTVLAYTDTFICNGFLFFFFVYWRL